MSDGARLYPIVADDLGLPHYHVSHGKGVWRKMCRRGRKPALQAHSGTIDSSWKYLQQSLPPGLAVSLPGNEPRANPELLQYVYQWCTRFHHDGSMRALLLMLGRFLKQNRFRNL